MRNVVVASAPGVCTVRCRHQPGLAKPAVSPVPLLTCHLVPSGSQWPEAPTLADPRVASRLQGPSAHTPTLPRRLSCLLTASNGPHTQ